MAEAREMLAVAAHGNRMLDMAQHEPTPSPSSLWILADLQAAVGLLDHTIDAIDEALLAAPEQKIDEPTILWRLLRT